MSLFAVSTRPERRPKTTPAQISRATTTGPSARDGQAERRRRSICGKDFFVFVFFLNEERGTIWKRRAGLKMLRGGRCGGGRIPDLLVGGNRDGVLHRRSSAKTPEKTSNAERNFGKISPKTYERRGVWRETSFASYSGGRQGLCLLSERQSEPSVQ